MRRVASSPISVLIHGESGTGKEVIARYIHKLSERENGPFISVNCGALPENLLESELFGHVKGSFTGAHKDKDGLLVAARGGTFFLDEVAEMSPALQVKLLRALQEREVVRVGGQHPVRVDTRVLAATHRGTLSQDLDRLERSDGRLVALDLGLDTLFEFGLARMLDGIGEWISGRSTLTEGRTGM